VKVKSTLTSPRPQVHAHKSTLTKRFSSPLLAPAKGKVELTTLYIILLLVSALVGTSTKFQTVGTSTKFQTVFFS